MILGNAVAHPQDLSSNDLISIAMRATEEYVTDAFIKFLMCSNVPSVGSDALKDPCLRELLERAYKYGVPSSLLGGESVVIEKSVFNIKHEVYQYMLMVTESWKTTGCTLMIFNLQNHENKGRILSGLEKDMYVIALYCPKGILFVEAQDPHDGYTDALKRHSPSLHIDDKVHWLYHSASVVHDLCEDHLCELNDDITIDWTIKGSSDCLEMNFCQCLRNYIQGMCLEICSRSEWAQRLINRAVEIHEYLCCSFVSKSCYYKILRKKGLSFRVLVNKNAGKAKAMHASRLSIFLSIMLLQDGLKKGFSHHMMFENVERRADKEAITNDYKFWGDRWKLERVLTLALKIPDVMDTLVPTAAYLAMAIDQVKHTIVGLQLGEDALQVWKELESCLNEGGNREAASYLNPVYFLQQQDPRLHTKFKDAVIELIQDEEECGKLEAKLQRYADVFSNLSEHIQLQDYHPVKLWEEYGHDLPILRKHAIRLLSQPLNCMCNQVKEHLYQLKGTDDYILRLNLRMMQHFTLLGDDIYKPLDLSELQLMELDADEICPVEPIYSNGPWA